MHGACVVNDTATRIANLAGYIPDPSAVQLLLVLSEGSVRLLRDSASLCKRTEPPMISRRRATCGEDSSALGDVFTKAECC